MGIAVFLLCKGLILTFYSFRDNFLRLCLIVIDNISKVLRIVFQSIYCQKTGNPWDSSNGPQLCSEILNRNIKLHLDQVVRLCNGDQQEWDVTLLCYVLLNSCWTRTLVNRKAVEKLRDIRNKCFAHPSKAGISKDDLYRIVEEVSKAYSDLLDGIIARKEKERLIHSMRAIEEGVVCIKFITY